MTKYDRVTELIYAPIPLKEDEKNRWTAVTQKNDTLKSPFEASGHVPSLKHAYNTATAHMLQFSIAPLPEVLFVFFFL